MMKKQKNNANNWQQYVHPNRSNNCGLTISGLTSATVLAFSRNSQPASYEIHSYATQSVNSRCRRRLWARGGDGSCGVPRKWRAGAMTQVKMRTRRMTGGRGKASVVVMRWLRRCGSREFISGGRRGSDRTLLLFCHLVVLLNAVHKNSSKIVSEESS